MGIYKHLFFDLDHTLWDFEKNSAQAMRNIFTDLLAPRMKVPFELFHETYVEVNDRWWDAYRNELVSKEDLRVGRFSESMQRFGLVDLILADEVATAYTDIGPYMPHLHEGAHEVLHELGERGYIMHIITNGFEEVQHIKLRESDLKKYFIEIITSEEAGAKKPDPVIFEHAFKRSRADASESLMVGDSLGADIHGAMKVGMDQAYFNPKGIPHAESPTYEVKALKELLGIL